MFTSVSDIYDSAMTIKEFRDLIATLDYKIEVPENEDSVNEDNKGKFSKQDLIEKKGRIEKKRKISVKNSPSYLYQKTFDEINEKYTLTETETIQAFSEFLDYVYNRQKDYVLRDNMFDVFLEYLKRNASSSTEDDSLQKYSLTDVLTLFVNLQNQQFENKEDLYNILKNELNEHDKNVKKLLNKSEEEIYSDYQKSVINFNNSNLKSIINGTNFRNYELPDYSNYVFLSYAVKDILTAIALFFIFREHKIFLYVDFLFNSSPNNVKKELSAKLDKCNQFLFLESPNSMVVIDSKTYIRPWCFWEHGYFLRKIRNSPTFLPNLSFKIGFAKLKGDSQNVEMVKGFQNMTDIQNGKII
jgi:hypothetical protein